MVDKRFAVVLLRTTFFCDVTAELFIHARSYRYVHEQIDNTVLIFLPRIIRCFRVSCIEVYLKFLHCAFIARAIDQYVSMDKFEVQQRILDRSLFCKCFSTNARKHICANISFLFFHPSEIREPGGSFPPPPLLSALRSVAVAIGS